MKSKIIHIITHPISEDERCARSRPSSSWNLPNGNWIGFWGDEWADQIANECLKISDEFEHEVWQPDLKADKIYSHTFENGMTHRLFPAIKNTNKEIISTELISFLQKKKENNLIFHIGYPHFSGINKKLLDSVVAHKFILTFHGEMNFPFNALFKMQRDPFKKFYYLKQHFTAKKYSELIDHVTYPSEKNINTLRRYYTGKMTKLTMGIDTDKFRIIDKNDCRQKLNIPQDKKVLLTVSRLYDHKQVDKLIEVLSEVDDDFFFIVVGHGTRDYENYLKQISFKLIEQKKIRFEGYKNSDELVNYFNAADLFVHVSRSEAGPVSIMEATACGLPVFCTNVGNTAEVLKENKAGILVDIKDYKDWKEKLLSFLKGYTVKALDIDIVKQHYDWNNVANKFLEIYRGVLNGN